jgi:WD40 repeat protein
VSAAISPESGLNLEPSEYAASLAAERCGLEFRHECSGRPLYVDPKSDYVICSNQLSYPAASPLWQAAGETAVWSLAFAPDGGVLAAGGSFGSVRLRSRADGSSLGTLQAGDTPVNALAWSSDGRLLAAAEGAAIRVFSPGSGASLGLLTGHTGTVFSLAFSPDARTLASGSDDHTARLWAVP